MNRGRGSTLLLVVCMALLAVMCISLSAFPVNEGVVDSETAAKKNETLWALQQLAAQMEEQPALDGEGLPILRLYLAEADMADWEHSGDSEDDEADEVRAVSAWLTLGDGTETIGSYADVLSMGEQEEGGIWLITLRAISRKGRLHRRSQTLLGMPESEQWLLYETGGAGQLLPVTDEDGTILSAAVRLFVDEEDIGRCVLCPIEENQ